MEAPQPAQGWRIARSRLPLFDLSFRHLRANDYDDINGRNIARVMKQCGWAYLGRALRIDALFPSSAPGHRSQPGWSVVGSAWAGVIATHRGDIGLNISYATDPRHRGQGLAVLLSCCAAIEHSVAPASGLPTSTFINVQSRSTNLASQATARALGLPACSEAAFTVSRPGRPDLLYLGFREPIEPFLTRARRHAESRVTGYIPGVLGQTPWLELPNGPTDSGDSDAVVEDTFSLT